MSIYYEDDSITLLHGDALEQARTLPDGSVDCIVTSPPYFGLRDYGNDGQYGLEETPAAYVETMRELFSELRRALADDGTLWLNIGDSYGKDKQLLGIPWLVALALQGDGWILRNAIVWHKPNAMPSPVKDRCANGYEMVFLLAKSPKYWFGHESIREAQSEVTIADIARRKNMNNKGTHGSVRADLARSRTEYVPADGKRTARDVWSINTSAFAGAHFAVFPVELARRCVVAGCKPGGTVLDPFSGSGTTGLTAGENGRKYIGIDINAEYLKMSLETRLQTRFFNLGGTL